MSKRTVKFISGGPVKVDAVDPSARVRMTGIPGPQGIQGLQGIQGTIAISTAEFDGGSAFTVFINSASLDLGSAT